MLACHGRHGSIARELGGPIGFLGRGRRLLLIHVLVALAVRAILSDLEGVIRVLYTNGYNWQPDATLRGGWGAIPLRWADRIRPGVTGHVSFFTVASLWTL